MQSIFKKNKSREKRPSFISLVLWAIGLSRPYTKYVVIILFAMLLQTLIGLATPWPLKIIIDNLLNHLPLPKALSWLDSFLQNGNYIQLAAVAALSFVLITAIGSFAGFIDSYYNDKVAQYIAYDLRKKMYHHMQHLSLSYYDSHQIGKLISTITEDVSTIQDFATSTLLNILVDSLNIVGMVAIMFYLDSGFTLVGLAVTPFLLFFLARFKKAMEKSTREVREDQSNLFVVLQKGLASIKSVNAFGRQDYEEERLMKVSHETVNAALKEGRVKSVISPVSAVTVSGCTAFVLWRGADLVMNGAITIGALTVFLWYLAKFFTRVQDLTKMTSTIAHIGVALERIQAILETTAITRESPNAKHPGKLEGEIVFEDVNFSYSSDSPVIKNFNLVIQKGQQIGICGPTGVGKSTIVSLIARFYDPVSGRILIDGTDISEFTLDGLREQIAFVLQDTVLLYGSIRENIAYGRPDATEEEIIEAAKLANIYDLIQVLPHGLDTVVGERGVTLSGGERQRIGIARAVVRNSPILILDEPTSSLDAESEKIVLAALQKLMKGRTVITIAHRLNTIRHVDKIIVLNKGVIAEEGTHDELMRKGKIYEHLYNEQTRCLKQL